MNEFLIKQIKQKIRVRLYYYSNIEKHRQNYQKYNKKLSRKKRDERNLNLRLKRNKLPNELFELYDRIRFHGSYIPQYEINPRDVIETRTFNKKDFEYIKLMNNSYFPSLEENNLKEKQRKYISKKYGN